MWPKMISKLSGGEGGEATTKTLQNKSVRRPGLSPSHPPPHSSMRLVPDGAGVLLGLGAVGLFLVLGFTAQIYTASCKQTCCQHHVPGICRAPVPGSGS